MADSLFSLGEVRLRGGEYQQAIDLLRSALALFREIGERHGETKTLRGLAQALDGAGQPAAARAELAAALTLATETGNTFQQASGHWQQALTLYTRLGATEADQVRSRLSAQAGEKARPGRAGPR